MRQWRWLFWLDCRLYVVVRDKRCSFNWIPAGASSPAGCQYTGRAEKTPQLILTWSALTLAAASLLAPIDIVRWGALQQSAVVCSAASSAAALQWPLCRVSSRHCIRLQHQTKHNCWLYAHRLLPITVLPTGDQSHFQESRQMFIK